MADPLRASKVNLLRPYPTGKMRAWRVSRDMGNVRNNRPDLIDPI